MGHRDTSRFWTTLAGALLCASYVLAAGGKERLPVGAFTARRFATPPVINGKVAPGEWDRAFATSGMMTPFDHTLQQAETTIALGYDDEMFYFLFECTRGDREWKLWKSVRENDGYSFGDPSIEIWVTPPTLVPETYQNILNTYPAVLDQKMIPTRGYTAQGWKGNWQIGVSESQTNYVIEAAVPARDFGDFAPLKDGAVWRFLLCRTSPGTLSRSQASWSITQGFSELIQHPTVRLAKDSAVVQVRGVTSAFTGRYRFPVAVIAPDSRDATVTLELRWHKAVQHSDEDRVETRKVSVPKGGIEKLVLAGDVTDLKAGNFTLTATEANGQAIFSQSFPFEVNGWTPRPPARPERDREAKELDLMVKYGPQQNVIILRADIIDLPTREAAAGGTVSVLNPSDNKVLMTHDLPPFREWYSSTHFNLNKLKIPVVDYQKIAAVEARNRSRESENKKRAKRGQKPLDLDKLPTPDPMPVRIEVNVTDAEGKTLKTGAHDMELRRSVFEWERNTVGITDKVIPPWTPVTYEAGKVGVWNRALDLNGLGLIDGIANGGVSQVRQMRLVAVQDGKAVEIKPTSPRLEKQVEAEVRFSGEARAAGLQLNATTRVEFDGFVLSRLTIAPADANTPTAVDKLFLEIVLPEEEATHFCTTAGGWTAVHAKTPVYWSSRQTASGMLIGDFVPYVWLSNSDRGFLWFADNDKGWITDDDKSLPTQEILRENGTVTLRIHFIEVPTTLAKATTIEYGYQTFPSRPLPAGWRAIVCNQGKKTLPDAPNTYFWFDGDWAVLWPYYCSPYPWKLEKSKDLFSRYSKRSDHRPMVGSIAHSIGRYRDYEGREFKEYAVDWASQPGNLSNANVVQSKGPIDFRLYHYQMWVQEAGFRGLYIDENYLALEQNFLTGGAYLRPDGRLQPGYSYLGLREYFKRMMIMFHYNGVPRPNLWQHISSGAAYHAWFGDIYFEGENVEPTDDNFDYIEVLPAERMRAIASSACSGGAMTMMCQSQRHATVFEPKHTHQFLGWVMAHDVLPEQVREYEIIAQEARLYEADVRFLAYWKSDTPLKTQTPDCVVSAHAVGKRALLWVANTAREDRQARVDIDFDALGIPADKCVALNAETGAELEIRGNALTVPVLKRDFAAVHLIGTEALEGGASLRASFDKGRKADDAFGSQTFVPLGRMTEDQELPLVEGRTGKALPVGDGLAMWPHLHATDEEGRIRFAGLVGEDAKGAVVATAPSGARYPTRPPVHTLRVALEGKPVELVFGWTPAGGNTHADKQVRAPAPAAGWREFDLSWKAGQATLRVDGKEAGSVPIEGMNICNGTGKALLESGNVVFGGRRSAIAAIDDVACYRRATP